MGQVNVTYPEPLLAELDALAAERRMQRAELLRAIAQEAVDARAAGRLAFRREEGPALDLSVSRLVVELREAVTEFRRTIADILRREKRQVEVFTAAEEKVQVATERVAGRIRELNRESYRPFVEKLESLEEHLEAAEERALAGLEQPLQEISRRLDESIAWAREPRHLTLWHLGDDVRIVASVMAHLILLFAGAVILGWTILMSEVEGFGVRYANHLLYDSKRVCRLINRGYEVEDCRVPEGYRQKGLRAIAADKGQK